ncbi:CRISPR-associated protein Csx19 [candidate division KSB1 bacterium]|nr:CRISPR-associated protein Csx19 [candidate division KSB1 bacterium]
MKRIIQELQPALMDTISYDGTNDVKAWLVKQAEVYKLKWLLAHADDGVIWGRIDGKQLITSHEAAKGNAVAEKACPELRVETLQQARLFAEHAELLLWRNGDNVWHARLIRDAQAGEKVGWDESFDELQLLWGTNGKHLHFDDEKEDFTLLEDGAQGLRHAVPIKLTLGEKGVTTPPRLRVRHYLVKEDFARVAVSRLVGFDKR